MAEPLEGTDAPTNIIPWPVAATLRLLETCSDRRDDCAGCRHLAQCVRTGDALQEEPRLTGRHADDLCRALAALSR